MKDAQKTKGADSKVRSEGVKQDGPAIGGLGKIAEVTALATAAGTMALGTLRAGEHDHVLSNVGEKSATSENRGGSEKSSHETTAPTHSADHQLASVEHDAITQLANGQASQSPHVQESASTNFTQVSAPQTLEAHIAHEIASSVTHALTAAGSGMPVAQIAQTVADHVVKAAVSIANDVRDELHVSPPSHHDIEIASGVTGGLSHLGDLHPSLDDNLLGDVEQTLKGSVGHLGVGGILDAVSGSVLTDILSDPPKPAVGVVTDVKDELSHVADLSGHLGKTLVAGVDNTLDNTLGNKGVLDVLHGTSNDVPAQVPVNDIVSQLDGVKAIELSGLVHDAHDAVTSIPDSLLGGQDHGKNPLADIFYDDGGADSVHSGLSHALLGVTSDPTEPVKLGFLAQPLESGDELGGVSHVTNALHLL